MYQVLARKWRPRSFDEVVGQKHVTTTLSNALKANRLAHAYIFSGLRGTGKTSIARILAKCLNCEQGPTTQPCGGCTSCLEVAESRSLDVLELDAASRRGIDSIRELQEVISYAPVRDRYKVLILDEFHMLTKEAFNALLKTLEEPPPNLFFILATTEIQKVLPTILSRCQVFELRRIAAKEVAEHLRRICEAEAIKVSDLVLERIARAGEGSVRDSLSVLERVLAFSGKEIEDEDVLRMLGGVRVSVLSEMIAGIAGHDAGKMLQVLDGLVDEGHDLLHFWNELISAIRDLMMLSAAPERTDLLARSPEEAKALEEAASGLSLEDLTRIFGIVADLEVGLKTSSQPRFLFEAMLIRLSSLGAVRPIEEFLGSLGPAPGGNSPPGGGPPPSGKRSRSSSASGVQSRPSSMNRAEKNRKQSAPAARESFAAELIASVAKSKPLVGALLESSSLIAAKDDGLSILFPAGAAAARQIERGENLELIEEHAEKILGRRTRVRVTNGAAAEPAVEKPKPPPRPEKASRSAKQARKMDEDLLKRAKSEPGVKKLLHEFGAQVVKIRPLPAVLEAGTTDQINGNTEEPS
jgi:DNA polymerase-3 subunit gamma/tau